MRLAWYGVPVLWTCGPPLTGSGLEQVQSPSHSGEIVQPHPFVRVTGGYAVTCFSGSGYTTGQ
jgi:hypothetical protein